MTHGYLMIGFLALAAALPCQAQVSTPASGSDAGSSSGTAVPILAAMRVEGVEPTVDGDLSDPVWTAAPLATGFLQLEPDEGAPASERTEVRVLYGSDALFVAFRAFDSRPDSIAGQLTRRDQHSYSDRVHVWVDSYYDRRTAFHFAVNPVGVKQDLYRYDDTSEDASWDAVWDVATRIDDLGWTAEFRIPYSQLRFTEDDDQTWGINFARDIARRNETSTWAPLSQEESGIVSRSGELQGLRDLKSPRRLEVMPYAVTRATMAPVDPDDPFREPTELDRGFGADVKYGLTGNLTLDLTVNPDFGQVEADPAQVNLSAFESFFPERRPFFIEGAGIFRFGLNQGDGDGANQSLFYSRRIGRSPQGEADDRDGFVDAEDNTTIHAAAKVSGKTSGGWSLGFLHALTAEEDAEVISGDGIPYEDLIEPRTNYSVARVQKDFREGRSALGLIATSTLRDRAAAEALGIRRGAYTGGVDFRHRFGGENYLVRGYLLGSHVWGSREAIEATQRSSARYFQRPDADHTRLDPDRTSLGGWSTDVSISKIGGGFWRFATGVQARSPGFELNDLGFMTESDYVSQFLWVGYHHTRPTEHFQRIYLNFNSWQGWDFGGLNASRGGNVNGSFTLKSYWGGYAGVNHQLENYSTGALRGGPALLEEPSWNGWLGVYSDSREAIQVNLSSNWSARPESDSWSWSSNAHLRWRPSSRTNLTLGPFLSRRVDDRQWVEDIETDAGRTHYLLGRLDQTTTGLTARLDMAFTPELSLQLYAQPFVSAGSYGEFKRVADPRAPAYGDRFQLIETAEADGVHRVDLDGDGTPDSFDDPDFNFKQFRSNAVLRWEYRPGSVLFLVWSQARDHSASSGSFELDRDLDRLFSVDGTDVLMLKVSYWLSP